VSNRQDTRVGRGALIRTGPCKQVYVTGDKVGGGGVLEGHIIQVRRVSYRLSPMNRQQQHSLFSTG
jgi:hypothetical protein